MAAPAGRGHQRKGAEGGATIEGNAMSHVHTFAPAFALRNALQGLAGNKGQAAAAVAALVTGATMQALQHGNLNPLQAAAEGVSALKGTSKKQTAVREGFAAALQAAGFTVQGGKVTDTRATKRMPAAEAAPVADAAGEAFMLAWGAIDATPVQAKGKAQAKAGATGEGATIEGEGATAADPAAALAVLLSADDRAIGDALHATDPVQRTRLQSILQAIAAAAAVAPAAKAPRRVKTPTAAQGAAQGEALPLPLPAAQGEAQGA
jgi:hypothetical protein